MCLPCDQKISRIFHLNESRTAEPVIFSFLGDTTLTDIHVNALLVSAWRLFISDNVLPFVEFLSQ